MLLFGLGAASPLLAVGMLSREALAKTRGRMLSASRGLKAALGVTFVLIGASIVTGARQDDRDRAGRGLAAMAYRPHHAFLRPPDHLWPIRSIKAAMPACPAPSWVMLSCSDIFRSANPANASASKARV